MNAFNKRFFVCIALIFLGFTAICLEIKKLIIFPAFTFFIAVFYLVLSKRKKKHKNLKLVMLLALCAALLGTLCSNILLIKNEALKDRYTGEHTISGYVLDVASNQDFLSEYVFRVEYVDYQRASFDIILVTDYKCDLYRGDFAELQGNISSLEEYGDLAYLRNNNTYDYPLVCAIDDRTEISFIKNELRIPLVLSDLNSRLSSRLKAILGDKSGSLASALLLGNRDQLSDNTLRDFKRAGVYHMLALSGLHVAILIGIFDRFLKMLCAPRGIRISILTLLSLFYVALTGFALSACRSMLMLWVMYLSLTLGKRRDSMTALFLAVSVIVLISPSSVLDIGLLLSFLSTFGVISATLICEKLKLNQSKEDKDGILAYVLKVSRWLLLVNISSLCVFICTLPCIMLWFGEVSLATFLSNVFMGAVCEVFMVCALLALSVSGIPFVCIPFAELSARLGELFCDIVSLIADIEGVMLSLSYPCVKLLSCALFVAFIVCLAIRLGRKWMIFVPSVAFAVLVLISVGVYTSSREGYVRAEYILGDTVVLSSADEVYICDASNGSYGAFYEGIEVAKENCFTELDGVIITHYHSKHIVSLERLSKNYKVHRVLLPMPQNKNEDSVMRSIIRVLEGEGVEVCIYDNSREIDILSGRLKIIPRAYIAGYAHPSIALSFAYGDDRFTFLNKSFFDTYHALSGAFDEYIKDSDYLIIGNDGRAPEKDFHIFDHLKDECEVSFAAFDIMEKSDFDAYLDRFKIYFDVEYKKYDLK